MKIELQEPFKSNWLYGYLRTNNENRRMVDLYLNDKVRTTVPYARYLMCVKIGFVLSNEFEVDHIDNDKTNDDINNLQILTKQQNKEKERLRYLNEEQLSFGYHCAHCWLPFILTEREKKTRLANQQQLAFCSRSCSANYYAHTTKTTICKTISDSDKLNIRHLRQQGLSCYKISEQTGMSRTTVMKYW